MKPNLKHALYELTRSQDAKQGLNSLKLLDEFEDNFVIPLIHGSLDNDSLCDAARYWQEKEWLQKWLDTYVNVRNYELFIGNVQSLEKGLPHVGEKVDRPTFPSEEGSCAFIWHLNKKEAAQEAAYHMAKEKSGKGKTGYIIRAEPSNEDIVVDYKNFYGVLRKWYKGNTDIQERWDRKFNENLLKTVYDKAKTFIKNNPDIANADTVEIDPENKPSFASANHDWDWKNIGESLKVLAEEGNDVLVSGKIDQGVCEAVWVNVKGKVQAAGNW